VRVHQTLVASHSAVGRDHGGGQAAQKQLSRRIGHVGHATAAKNQKSPMPHTRPSARRCDPQCQLRLDSQTMNDLTTPSHIVLPSDMSARCDPALYGGTLVVRGV